MTDRELMQQALDALRMCTAPANWTAIRTSVEALRARLAQPEPEPINYEDWKFNPMTGEPLWDKQPEPEPVAWMREWNGDVQINKLPAECYGDHWTRTPLYTAPSRKEWQGLTDEERQECYWIEFPDKATDPATFASAIEAKLKEKNG